MNQIGIAFAFAVLLAIGTYSFTNPPDASAQEVAADDVRNVFAGKAVIITATPGVAGEPQQNIQVESLGGRKFLVHEVNSDGGESFEYWRAVDEISRIRVFNTMQEATVYYNSRIEKGVFH